MSIATAVYKITNTVNGKLYIGISSDPAKRWWAHRNQTKKTHTKLYNALKKYGVEAFTFEVLHWCGSREDARELENLAVEVCETVSKGYNMCPGGGGGVAGPDNPYYGKALPAEVRAKMSAAAKKRGMSDERKAALAVSRKGSKKPDRWKQAMSAKLKGRPLSIEHKDKLCEAWKRRKARNEPVHNAKPVMCIQTGEIFGSGAKAAQHFGLNPASLHQHLYGRQKAVKGFTFRWYTMEPEEKTEDGPVQFTLNNVSVIADSVEPDIEISEEV